MKSGGRATLRGAGRTEGSQADMPSLTGPAQVALANPNQATKPNMERWTDCFMASPGRRRTLVFTHASSSNEHAFDMSNG